MVSLRKITVEILLSNVKLIMSSQTFFHYLGFIRNLGNMRKNLAASRYFTYVFISLWKMLVFFATMLFSIWIIGHNVGNTFSKFTSSFGDHQINVTEIRPPLQNGPDIPGGSFLEEVIKEKSAAYIVRQTLLIQILAAYVCYIFAKFACKICIQGFSFAFPVSLAVPVTLSLLISLCGLRSESPCFWESVLPQYLFWTCPKGEFISDFIGKEVSLQHGICLHCFIME